MDPGQDLLLAALSESGICPNDIGLFDVDSQDVAQPSTTQQSISISALDVGVGTEPVEVVRPDPPAAVPIVTIRHKPQPSTTTFVLNQLNQLPSLGAVATKQSATNPIKHTITVTKVVHVANSALRGSTPSSTSAPPSASTVVPSNRDQQIQLKDLLRASNVKSAGVKDNSLMELMKLKPPPDIAPPVATAAATGPGEINNGIKKEVLGKDAARIWINDDIKLQNFSHSLKPPGLKEEEEPEEEEEDELGHAETYAEYMPMKLKIGLRHPDPVVETSSLSSVSPPDVWYRLSIPEEAIDRGCLSALQLEAITYAAQQHETFLPNGDRAAYLIGDGAGVGKGRTIAGIIYENYLLGRKRSLWFSVSNDLKYDAERDLRDIGAKNIQVHSLNKFKYGKISSKHNGSVKKGVIFATYSSLIGESQSGGKYKTRFQQLLHWCGEDFDGVIVYDECHKAKNVCPIGSSKPTKTGLAVLELQNKLPKARVVYASATGASEPRNMAYMNRLGIWGPKTPFREFGNFIQAVERRGVGAMEIVAMDMKLRGMYIARQLSFTGVTFKIEEVSLTQQYIHMYNKSVRLWVSAREKFQQAANLMDAEQRMKKSMWGQFWSAHQRFFKYLCIASKVRRVVQLAREEVQNGKCVVIGLQSTGEARTLEALEEGGGELNDFVSTAKGVLQSLIEKHFPAPDRQKLYSLLGIDLSAKKTPSPSDAAAQKEQKGKKRKGPEVKKQQKKKPRKHGGLSGTSSEESQSEESDRESGKDSDDSFKSVSSADEDDDFNPFRDESDDDEEDDPWLIRKEPKKRKEKKKKKRRKSIDPDSIQSALLASGLGSTRPAFTVNPPSAPATVKAESQDSCLTSQDAVEHAQMMKKGLLEELEELSEHLPPNTLDELIDELGGPDNVAEMTGRKGRVVSNDDGTISYESRSELDVPVEILNLTEKQRFMDGEKHISIISEAASSGISLQADRRVKNQRRRVHMTLELPWSADRAIQQFGRTHRSNQVTAPEYVFLISELAGEQRFASIVAKRLESLGALTHGDRRATETRDLSRFNFDNKYGRNALEIVMKSIVKLDSPLVSPPSNFKGDFFKEIQGGLIGVGLINVEDRSGALSLDKDYNNIGKFLNRILGMAVQQQNALFQYFSDTLAAVIQEAKKNGRYDMGILDLGSGDEKVKKVDCRKFLTPGYTTSGHVELYTVSVERGMSWEDATHVWADQNGPDDGFYVQMRNNKKTSILVKEVNTKKRLFLVYRPNTGRQLKLETYADIKKKFKKVLSEDAKQYWTDQHKSSAKICSHAFWRGNCKKASVGLQCEVGLRCRTYYVLCGSVLSVWNELEEVLTPVSGTNVKVQIVRLKTEDEQRIVGLIIPANCVSPLINKLSTSDQCQQLAVQELQKRQQLHPQSLSHAPNT
ncbi:protein strawberry notch homolog 1 isoform X1 [Parambassis ranga]|uniref:Protein strawberry notch homolog 1 n=1 Tax=Parambassis ranga TaxID=210632 RepID=A0A6P7J958_9TELE|nr:protein strawberry notch homolog 1 isoform X1 [Parambassis ranga]XP_028273353.1 protein strawberry notch homolog 1 isoform X1 [Parambassis ranga]XP_028273354.1 protein strawberry notch homolog 1 isoform X1 [Parambassis ranga]XP_028273356.1 protein strawberry notch homolog 1 isoform X1 [Parambassis ranga]XP_028273357.1 protein strawberry notch homolog 1 isoform X1 [Parambassis ranga]XP_028273358.1 protein strawberry notch homolog 1 isoform X1 [Parambassis ranga]XP_028273359.1 protein strawb